MIISFQSDATASLYHTQRSSFGRRMPPAVRARLLRRLDMVNAAHDLDDLRALPGVPAALADADRRGRRSIRVDDEQLIGFRWEDGDASDVTIEEDAT